MVWLLLACDASPPPQAAAPPAAPPAPVEAPAPPAAPSSAGDDDARLARAQAAAQAFAPALRARLTEAIQQGGPPQGIAVCNEDAPRIAAQVAAEHGVRIGRASLKLRNPANAGPAWVQELLRAERAEPFREVVEVDGQRVARLALPIRVEAPCLACHGAELAPPVAEALAARYPQDAATGYAVGDLRGLLWVEAP